jgi:hypothetical protein
MPARITASETNCRRSTWNLRSPLSTTPAKRAGAVQSPKFTLHSSDRRESNSRQEASANLRTASTASRQGRFPVSLVVGASTGWSPSRVAHPQSRRDLASPCLECARAGQLVATRPDVSFYTPVGALKQGRGRMNPPSGNPESQVLVPGFRIRIRQRRRALIWHCGKSCFRLSLLIERSEAMEGRCSSVARLRPDRRSRWQSKVEGQQCKVARLPRLPMRKKARKASHDP